jgi:hypothetical protein
VSGWPRSRIFGVIGSLGMFVFFLAGITAGWDDAPLAILVPSGLAMWVGYPASWYYARRERNGS